MEQILEEKCGKSMFADHRELVWKIHQFQRENVVDWQAEDIHRRENGTRYFYIRTSGASKIQDGSREETRNKARSTKGGSLEE